MGKYNTMNNAKKRLSSLTIKNNATENASPLKRRGQQGTV
jgi:hypothetical protein